MANVPSLRWSVLDVLSTCRELAKTVDQKKVLQEQGKYFYKLSLSEIVTLLNSATDPSYFTFDVLGEISNGVDNELLTGSTISALDSSGLLITRTSGTWVTAARLHVVIITKSTGAIAGQAVIVLGALSSADTVAAFTIESGSLVTYNATTENIAVLVEKVSVASTTISLTDINYDRIVALEDSVYGQCVYVTPNEFSSLGRADFGHKSYDDDIVWTQFGNVIRIRNGSKVTAPGNKTLFYQRQPDYPDTDNDWATDMVDLGDKWIPLLIKRIYTFMILQTENDVPHNLAQEMQLDYAQISGMTQAEIANKVKNNRSTAGDKTQ